MKLTNTIACIVGLCIGSLISVIAIVSTMLTIDISSCDNRGFCSFSILADEFCKTRNLRFLYVTKGVQVRCESKDNAITEFYNITFQLDRIENWNQLNYDIE